MSAFRMPCVAAQPLNFLRKQHRLSGPHDRARRRVRCHRATVAMEVDRMNRPGTVLDVFNPKADLGEYLAPKVALLKAVFGIDEHGKLTKPPPPEPFRQQLFTYIMCGRIVDTRRLPE